jgi:hypothetical protein
MIRKFTSRIIFAAFLLCLAVSASAGQSKVIEFVVDRPDNKIFTLHINGKNFLYENNSALPVLFTPDAFYFMSDIGKDYEVEDYDKYPAEWGQMISEESSEFQKASSLNIKMKMTKETDRISGIKVHKVVLTIGGKPRIELWISDDLTPKRLKEMGKKLRPLTPDSFWLQSAIVLPLYILLEYGVPLKIVYVEEDVVMQGKILEKDEPDSLFQVPADYIKKN